MAANAPKVVGSARANAAHPKRRDLLGCARLRQMNFKHLRGEARYGYPALAMRNSTARWSLCKEGHLEKSLGWESHSYKTLCSIMRALKNLELKGRPRDTAWGRGGSDRTRHGVDDRRQHPGYASHTFPSTASSNIEVTARPGRAVAPSPLSPASRSSTTGSAGRDRREARVFGVQRASRRLRAPRLPVPSASSPMIIIRAKNSHHRQVLLFGVFPRHICIMAERAAVARAWRA